MFFVEIENVSNLYKSGRGFYKQYKTLGSLLRYAVNSPKHQLNTALKQGATLKIYTVPESRIYDNDSYELIHTVK